MKPDRHRVALPAALGAPLRRGRKFERAMVAKWPLGRLLGIVGMPLLIAGMRRRRRWSRRARSPPMKAWSKPTACGSTRICIDKDAVLAARTVRVVPTVFSDGARLDSITDDQRKLVANAIDRSLCIGLSERLEVVPASQPADLTRTRRGHPYGRDRRERRGGEPRGQGREGSVSAGRSRCPCRAFQSGWAPCPWRRRRSGSDGQQEAAMM